MTEKKEKIKTKKPKAAKKPKFTLVSYTLKAVILVGQYANIQPEVTVKADSIEAAERAVMPYIETLFAKYRDGGIQTVKPVIASPVTGTASPAIVSVTQTNPIPPPPAMPPVVPSIPLTVPFNRAKGAIQSCTSIDALKLVSDQIEKSEKLIEMEKLDLRKLVAEKSKELNPNG